MTKSQYKDW